MARTKPDNVVIPHYSYGAIEGALAAVFGADSKIQRGALRGRLKHFQKLKWPGIKVGKGARISYTYAQGCQWAIALLISDIGLEPVIIVKFLRTYWPQLESWIEQATDAEAKAGHHVWLHLRPALITTPWKNKSKSAPPWRIDKVLRHWDPDCVGGSLVATEAADKTEFQGVTDPLPASAVDLPTINPPSVKDVLAADTILQVLNKKHPDKWACLLNLTAALIPFEATLKKGVSDGRT